MLAPTCISITYHGGTGHSLQGGGLQNGRGCNAKFTPTTRGGGGWAKKGFSHAEGASSVFLILIFPIMNIAVTYNMSDLFPPR